MEQKAALEKVSSLQIAKQVGENEAIFGTVTSQDVVDAIQAATGQEVDRRGINLPDINHLGPILTTLVFTKLKLSCIRKSQRNLILK